MLGIDEYSGRGLESRAPGLVVDERGLRSVMVKKGVMRFGKVDEAGQDSKLKRGKGSFSRCCLFWCYGCYAVISDCQCSTGNTRTTTTTTNMGSKIEQLDHHASCHKPVKENHIQVHLMISHPTSRSCCQGNAAGSWSSPPISLPYGCLHRLLPRNTCFSLHRLPLASCSWVYRLLLY